MKPDFDFVSQGDEKFKNKCGDIPVFTGFSLILINPPFLRERFLLILYILWEWLAKDGMMISINPARWFLDLLADCKSGSKEIKRAAKYLKRFCYSCLLIQCLAGNKLFKIKGFTDLGYFCFTKRPNNPLNKIYNDRRYLEIIDVSKKLCSGYRTIQSLIKESKTSDLPYKVYLFDRFLVSKKFYLISEKPTKSFVCFKTGKEAENFKKFCNSILIRNLIFMLTQNDHAQIGYIPIPGDFSRERTDEEISQWMGLTMEQEEYLRRQIQNYKVKDFINYGVQIDQDGNLLYNEI